MRNLLKKYGAILNDSFWSIAALVSMNVVAQFFVYPGWSRQYGAESYGDILYLMSFINIVAVSAGSALNYSRMTASIQLKTQNGEYNLIILFFCILSVPFCYVVKLVSGVPFQKGELLFYWLLQCVTLMRYYMDVDFRMSMNYKGYFKYYACISGGYLVGIWLSSITRLWELALIPGEIAGIVYVLIRGKYLSKGLLRLSGESRRCIKMFAIIFFSHLISNIIFNADRMLLKTIIGGTAVTIYYLSSLLGKTISLITTPLNSVIISYLVKYEGNMNRSTYIRLIAAMLVACVLLTCCCVLGSVILLPILYGESYDMTRPFLWISSISQVVYFATSVLGVVLLRFSKQEYQLYINLIYGAAFLLLGLPMTMHGGIWGFSYAILLANLVRMAVCVFYGSQGRTEK